DKNGFDPLQLDRARDTMSHRGPDDHRSLYDEYCYLGFRRLAIVDLTEHAAQPMQSRDSSLWIVFNGEIYNFIELRQHLMEQGDVFRSTSDTEVLLALYERYGLE